jgi:hypothetical protein
MHLLLLLVFFQVKTPDLTAPRDTTFIQNPKPILEKEKSFITTTTPTSQKATPGLNENSAITAHEMIEREIGGEEEAIGELKSKVGNLEDRREKNDRPDIDDLKETRTHFYWWTTTIGAALAVVGGLLARFRKILWEEVIRKRVKAFLIEAPPCPPPPSAP